MSQNTKANAVSYKLSGKTDTRIIMFVTYKTGEIVGGVDNIAIVKHFEINKDTKFEGWVD
jgi:hypothetical protein